MHQSGCSLNKSEFGEIISGSNHIPNSIPNLLTSSTRFFNPPWIFSSLTTQSPNDELSAFLFPNHPSSITSISIPKLEASFAIDINFSVLKSK